MRFSLSATTALLLQVSSTAEAASSSSSAAAATFLDAFEFGRSPPIQRKRNNHRGLVIQTESTTRRMTKTSKVDAVSSSSSESSSPDAKASKKSSSLDGSSSADAKSSKKGGYHLFSKYTKQATAEVAAFSMDAIGSMFIQPPHMTKAYKTADMFTEMSYSLADFDSFSMPLDFFSMSTSEFSMPGATTATPTSSPPEGSGDTGDASPSPTPRDPQPNNFQEVIFKYLSVCTGVELEMDCLTSTTIDALMTMNGGDATRARARRFLGTETTMAPTPVFVRPTRSPMAPTPSPTVTEVTPPTPAPGTPFPTEPVPPPTPVPGTPFPTEPVPPPTPVPGTPFPTEPVATPAPTDQCRPEVNDDDLLSILTTSKQECIDSGTPISDDEFQATFSSFMLIFDESNTCWNTLCGDSDPTGDLFFQILFDQASECADVTLSVDECILDHILEVVFQPDAPDNSATRVRRSLQESCCEEPTESDLNFYASYLLLSADAACADKGSVKITTDEWNKATDDLVKLFGATKCWGVEPCEDGDGEVVVNPTPSSSDEDAAISGDVVLPYYEGPVLSEDSEVCTLATDSYAPEEVRSLELSFYYQVETTSDSLDLGLIERELIALVCDDAGNERRLSELETEVVAVDASPEDVISEECEYLSSMRICSTAYLDISLTPLLLSTLHRHLHPFYPWNKLSRGQRSHYHPPCRSHHPQRRNPPLGQNRLPLPHCLGRY